MNALNDLVARATTTVLAARAALDRPRAHVATPAPHPELFEVVGVDVATGAPWRRVDRIRPPAAAPPPAPTAPPAPQAPPWTTRARIAARNEVRQTVAGMPLTNTATDTAKLSEVLHAVVARCGRAAPKGRAAALWGPIAPQLAEMLRERGTTLRPITVKSIFYRMIAP